MYPIEPRNDESSRGVTVWCERSALRSRMSPRRLAISARPSAAGREGGMKCVCGARHQRENFVRSTTSNGKQGLYDGDRHLPFNVWDNWATFGGP